MADRRVGFSLEELSLDEIAIHHRDVKSSLFEFFSGQSRALMECYVGAKIDEARVRSLSELDLTSSLSVLSSVEAAIRLDYLRRVYAKRRDSLSKAMYELHKIKENRVNLEDELLKLWRENSSMPKSLLNEVVGAFKYRHWLAHGRYWIPKLGRKYDYEVIFEIAQNFTNEMDEHSY